MNPRTPLPMTPSHPPSASRPLRGAWFVVLGLLLLGTAGCHPSVREQAEDLVRRYNRAVAEAYRGGDAGGLDRIAGPAEVRRIVGLIGVRADAGLRLDSELVWLEFRGVEWVGSTVRIRTHEQWRYWDQRVGSGRRVAGPYTDTYDMEYQLVRADRDWRVEGIGFAARPQVGRTNSVWEREAHLVRPAATAAGGGA